MTDENGTFLGEKVKLGKFSTESEIFFQKQRESETEGERIIALRGVDAPADRQSIRIWQMVLYTILSLTNLLEFFEEVYERIDCIVLYCIQVFI